MIQSFLQVVLISRDVPVVHELFHVHHVPSPHVHADVDTATRGRGALPSSDVIDLTLRVVPDFRFEGELLPDQGFYVLKGAPETISSPVSFC